MYNAEVLSKFPVVQHFPFGSLFSFDRDPDAKIPDVSVHTSSHPASTAGSPLSSTGPEAVQSTQAPWAVPTVPGPQAATAAPWASARSNPPPRDSLGSTRVPGTTSRADAPSRDPVAGTKAPWSNSTSTRRPPPPPPPTQIPTTRAPWATADAGRPRTELPTRASGAQPDQPKDDAS
jgi:serine/threonine-protein phosphatase 2A activator